MLPRTVIEPLQHQLQFAKITHQQDVALGYGEVFLPNALNRKYPNLIPNCVCKRNSQIREILS